MGTLSRYEELLRGFDWAIAERDLGFTKGAPLNIGWMCSDRICQLGASEKLALIWEDYQGNTKRYTYDELRRLSNAIAAFLANLGIRPGDRVCLFMDRIPELYIGFLGVLKMGAIAQPLFYKRSDMNHLEEKLREHQDKRVRMIITDGVFSMDGDIAKVDQIVALAEKYNAMVFVDDSHATGFIGKHGRGTHEHCGVLGKSTLSRLRSARLWAVRQAVVSADARNWLKCVASAPVPICSQMRLPR